TDAQGVAKMTLTSTTAGTSTVTASINGSSQSVAATFVADGSTAQIATGNLTLTTDGAVANGMDTDEVQVKITDANGNPLANQTVSFAASNGATVGATQTTDAAGMAKMTLTSTTAGTSDVTASINGSSQSVTATFVADSSTALITAGNIALTIDGAVANGTATDEVQVTVTDAKGNPLANQTVNFSASNGAVIGATQTTDAQGVAKMTLTSTVAGTSTVTASINGSSQGVTANFVADVSTATIENGAMTVVTNDAITDGIATNSVKVMVTDANGNPLAGQTVSLTADNGTVVGTIDPTAADGSVTVLLTSTTAGGGASQITATINGQSQTAQVAFVGNPVLQSAGFDNGQVYWPAGENTGSVTLVLTDSNNGKPIPDADVSLAADNGATFISSGSSAASATTDIDGKAVMTGVYLPNTGPAQLNTFAFNLNATYQQASVDTTIQASGLMLLTSADGATAGSGHDGMWIMLRDAQGHFVPNTKMYVSVDGGATWAYGDNGTSDRSTTNKNGTVSANIYSSTAGAIHVQASMNADMSNAITSTVTFK
ncbi:invasin, partial [Buttiauxella sp. B2]|uniref:Ig-like domain-containing protein n=1 Tax=Buttiauxella sp. B2 TaxID=2587812 RepID=UPI00117212D1